MAETRYQFEGTFDTVKLAAEVAAAGLPIATAYYGTGFAGPGTLATGVQIGFDPALSAGQETTLNAVVAAHVAGPVPTPTQRGRTEAITLRDLAADGAAVLLRGLAVALILEINALRQWDVSLKAAVAAATNFADLKTRIAALPAMPDRTLAQAKTAIGTAVSAGSAD